MHFWQIDDGRLAKFALQVFRMKNAHTKMHLPVRFNKCERKALKRICHNTLSFTQLETEFNIVKILVELEGDILNSNRIS